MVALQVMVKSAGCPRRGFAESTQIFGIVMMEKRTIQYLVLATTFLSTNNINNTLGNTPAAVVAALI